MTPDGSASTPFRHALLGKCANAFAEILGGEAGSPQRDQLALAIGGGLELALACDLRIAAGTIALAMPPAKLGLVYSHTGIRKFIETIGAPRTRELFLVGRRIDARTAREWGLVNAIAEEGRIAEEALELAGEIASNAPLAQAGNKRVINAVLSARTALDPDTERELIELRRACFASEDFREGVRAFSEKRVPRWRGR